jgi:DNA repair protein RadC
VVFGWHAARNGAPDMESHLRTCAAAVPMPDAPSSCSHAEPPASPSSPRADPLASSAERRIVQGPREKLADSGVESLSDAELVAILLGTGTRAEPVPALAEHLLLHTGGLWGLANASPPEMAAVCGVGVGKAARLAAGLELGRRASCLPLPRGARLGSSEDVFRAFGPQLGRLTHEELWALALDARQRVLCRILLARGGVSSCALRPADVFRPLLRAAASSVVLIHNHPSGACEPSSEDLEFTQKLAEAGELLGVFLLDHVIIGAEGYFSCLDAGSYRGSG